jgi:hypothetical protein
VDSHLQEAEWAASKYAPTFDEYMKNGMISIFVYSTIYLAVFFRLHLSEEQVQHEDYLRLFELKAYVARLMNDVDGWPVNTDLDHAPASLILI